MGQKELSFQVSIANEFIEKLSDLKQRKCVVRQCLFVQSVQQSVNLETCKKIQMTYIKRQNAISLMKKNCSDFQVSLAGKKTEKNLAPQPELSVQK